MELTLLWLSSSIALILLLYILTRLTFRPSGLPPGPGRLPIIGNLHLIGPLPHRSLARLAATHGPLMSLKLGQVTTLVVTSPKMAQQVLQTHDRAFSGRSIPHAATALNSHTSSLVWLPICPEWTAHRKLCNTQLFMPQRVNDTKALRLKEAKKLVFYVQKCSREGKEVDIGQVAFTTALNLLSNTVFSIDMGEYGDESAEGFKDLVWTILEEAGSPNMSDFFPGVAGMDLQGKRRRAEGLIGKLFEGFDELIEKRLERKGGEDDERKGVNDFLDSLIQSHNSRHAMRCLLADIFIAGTDTSSHTVEWAMAELLRNPISMKKAQNELIENIENGKEFDESDIQRLPYLQAIVKETLRLHPPTPFLLPRKAEKSVELCGYTIPEGTRVLVNVWAIGRDSNNWNHPEQFTPERFLGNDINYNGQDFELIPFGAGRRICPGLVLATRMVHLMLACLLRTFNWKLPEGMEPVNIDMTEKFGITLAKAVPLHAIPVSSASL